MTLAEFHASLPPLLPDQRGQIDRLLAELHEVLTNHFQQEAASFADTVIAWFARQTGALQAVFWAYEAEAKQIRAIAGFACVANQLPSPIVRAHADTPYRVLFTGHEAIHMQQIEGLWHHTATYAVPLRSWLVLPILINGQLRAAIELYHHHAFSQPSLHLLWQALLPLAAAWSGVQEHQERKALVDRLQEQTRQLHAQNEEIRAKSEELQQQAEELSAANDSLSQAHLQLAEQHKELASNKQSLEKKNQAIMASFQYAQRIQQAMLPSEDQLNLLLGEHVLFFRPRDIVSGDFYWAYPSHQGIWVVVADCTGHGVPAALLGMMGINLLEHTIQTQSCLSAADLLTQLDASVRETLRQDETENRDGMDMSVCLLNYQRQTIQYSGAMNAGYYFSHKGFQRLVHSRRAIGGKRHKRWQEAPFSNQEISMQGDGMLFLCSDGFQDQFGGPQNRKFMRKQTIELLQQIWTKPLKTQQAIIETTFLQWKDQKPQTDDVTILGIRL